MCLPAGAHTAPARAGKGRNSPGANCWKRPEDPGREGCGAGVGVTRGICPGASNPPVPLALLTPHCCFLSLLLSLLFSSLPPSQPELWNGAGVSPISSFPGTSPDPQSSPCALTLQPLLLRPPSPASAGSAAPGSAKGRTGLGGARCLPKVGLAAAWAPDGAGLAWPWVSGSSMACRAHRFLLSSPLLPARHLMEEGRHQALRLLCSDARACRDPNPVPSEGLESGGLERLFVLS